MVAPSAAPHRMQSAHQPESSSGASKQVRGSPPGAVTAARAHPEHPSPGAARFLRPESPGGTARTTSQAAEQLLVSILVLLRAIAIVQSLPALITGWPARPGAPLAAIAFGAFTAWSGCYLRWISARRTVRIPAAGRCDVLASCAVLLAAGWAAGPATSGASHWSQWAFTLVVPVAVSAGVLPATAERIAATTVLSASLVLPLAVLAGWLVVVDVASSVIALPAQAATGYYIARYLAGLATAAERERDNAARAAADAEADRHRALLHDQATILGLIARGADGDPRLARALRAQAAEEARKVSAFMRRPGRSAGTQPQWPCSLAALARRAGDAFPDLSPVLNTDLAGNAQLTPAAAAVVGEALTTLLHNVRLHARSTECVLYTAAGEQHWEISVADNGTGFDPERVRWGFGLSELVVARCARHGITAGISSSEGAGTLVVLRGDAATLRHPRNEPEPGASR